MTNLIIPVSGKSSRFPGMRPKWLLTMPDGTLMLEKAISGINKSYFDRVIIVCLKEHIEKYVNLSALNDRVSTSLGQSVEWVVLDEPTASQSETIFKGIQNSGISGPMYIKDCDNKFEYEFGGGNEVSVIDLNKIGLVDAKNKSYVQVNELGEITNIVEKQVISNLFCCGGYGFASALDFAQHYEDLTNKISGELYVSHIIYDMMLKGHSFKASAAASYIDWGTKDEFLSYCSEFHTVFCDIDGVLLKNGSAFGKDGWDTEPIRENIAALKRLQDMDRLYLVVTTSRPASEKSQTLQTLGELGLVPDDAIFGLPHSKRYLINDFAPTNPYPSALAINLDRNSTKLENLFGF